MRRTLIGAVIAVMVPAFAGAQETKPAPLADYVSFCLAVFEGAGDLPSKAGALGLSDATGLPGVFVTVGQMAIRTFKSAQSNQTVVVVSTTFKDGKESTCDVTLPTVAVARADLETMEHVDDLDGQIATVGATFGRWKMRRPGPPVLIRVLATKFSTMLMVQKYEPTPAGANTKRTR
jgi:hypothetical protein